MKKAENKKTAQSAGEKKTAQTKTRSRGRKKVAPKTEEAAEVEVETPVAEEKPKRRTRKPKAPAVEEVVAEVEEEVIVKVPFDEFLAEVDDPNAVFTHAELRNLKKRMKEAGHSREDINLVIESANKVIKADKEELEALTDRLEEQNQKDLAFTVFDPKENKFANRDGEMTTGEAYLTMCRSVMDGKQYMAALNHFVSEGDMSLNNYKEMLFSIERMEEMVAQSNDPAAELFDNIRMLYNVLRKEYLCHPTLPKNAAPGDELLIEYIGAYAPGYAKIERLLPLSLSWAKKVDKETGELEYYSRKNPQIQDATYIKEMTHYVAIPSEVAEEETETVE